MPRPAAPRPPRRPADAAPPDALAPSPAAAQTPTRAARDHALVERSGALLAVVDADGRVAYASPAFHRLLGCAPGEREGLPATVLVHPDDQAAAERMRTALEAAPGSCAQAELRLRHVDGSWRTVACSAEDLRDDPAVQGFVVAARDLTERLALEARLRQASTLEAVGRLAGGVAHDFNNLLMVVGGNAQLLRGRLGRAGLATDELDEIEQAIARATTLTRALLTVGRTRPRTARRGAPPRTDAAALVHGMRPMLQRLIGEDVPVVVRVEPDAGGAPLLVGVEAAPLEQAVLNLVVNARDAVRDAVRTGAGAAGPSGGHAVHVTVRAVTVPPAPIARGAAPDDGTLAEGTLAGGAYVSVAVRDTGVGMDAATRERVFEPFFTTKPRERGTGLGLATVYATARQARGLARVESAPGAGSTFELLLPRLAPTEPAPGDDALPTAGPAVSPAAATSMGTTPTAAPPAPAAPVVGASAASPAAPTGATILLVEDEPSVRTTVRRLLERAGYAVREAVHGEDALARLAEDGTTARGGAIDLVLSDVVMPRMGAERLLEALRRDWPALPVILMSGYSETAVREAPRGRAHPFAGVPLLEKPVRPAELAARIAEALAAAAPR